MEKESKFTRKERKQKQPPDGSFLRVDKKLLSKYGPEMAVFISNLLEKYKYYHDHEMLREGKMFFLTHEQQMEQTGLSLWKLRDCKQKAISEHLIETRWKGNPAKEWYEINSQLIDNQLGFGKPNDKPSGNPTAKPLGNPIAYKKNLKEEIRENANPSSLESVDKNTNTKYLPTLKEITEYFHSINSPTSPEKFAEHYPEGWTDAEAWKKKAREWKITERIGTKTNPNTVTIDGTEYPIHTDKNGIKYIIAHGRPWYQKGAYWYSEGRTLG